GVQVCRSSGGCRLACVSSYWCEGVLFLDGTEGLTCLGKDGTLAGVALPAPHGDIDVGRIDFERPRRRWPGLTMPSIRPDPGIESPNKDHSPQITTPFLLISIKAQRSSPSRLSGCAVLRSAWT